MEPQQPPFLPRVDAVPGGFAPPVGFADWARMVPVVADAAAGGGGRPSRCQCCAWALPVENARTPGCEYLKKCCT